MGRRLHYLGAGGGGGGGGARIEGLGRGLGDARFGGRGGIVGGGEGGEEVGVGPEFIVVVHGGMLVAEESEWKVVGSWM